MTRELQAGIVVSVPAAKALLEALSSRKVAAIEWEGVNRKVLLIKQ
jgi:hypothetical protein